MINPLPITGRGFYLRNRLLLITVLYDKISRYKYIT